MSVYTMSLFVILHPISLQRFLTILLSGSESGDCFLLSTDMHPMVLMVLVEDERIKKQWSDITVLPIIGYILNSWIISETDFSPFI